eukprot:5673415-Amphidinium_carterae.1
MMQIVTATTCMMMYSQNWQCAAHPFKFLKKPYETKVLNMAWHIQKCIMQQAKPPQACVAPG